MKKKQAKTEVAKSVQMEPVPYRIIGPDDLPKPPAIVQAPLSNVPDPFRYDEVRALRWADASKTAIACEVRFCIPPHRSIKHGSFIPFIAHPDDPHSHGQDIFAECVAGKWGKIGRYVAPPPEPVVDPATKLKQFLASNPDVLEHVMLGSSK